MFYFLLAFLSMATALQAFHPKAERPLRVETFVHQDVSLNMVSSLIIGSEAAVLIDLPLNHYLSARTCLDAFPNATFYANPEASKWITIGAPLTSAYWTGILGASEVVQNASVPVPYSFTFFTLPGDSRQPVSLIQPLTGDTVGETLFWLPSTRTLIAGDTVYSHELHLFMADMLTPSLTASWVSTLDFLINLNPRVVIPGHSLSNTSFKGTRNLEFTRSYLDFWQHEVEAKGSDYYSPQELYNILEMRFPGKLGTTSAFLLNVTAENFGANGTRFGHFVDFTVYNSTRELNYWEL